MDAPRLTRGVTLAVGMRGTTSETRNRAVLPLRPRRRGRARTADRLRLAAGVVASLALGLGSLDWALRPGVATGEIENGPWRTSIVTGSPSADLYTRARVAVDLVLALSSPETIYYTAATDSEGRPLDARCEYRLEGEALPARWWSVTTYGSDRFLIPNAAGRYSLSRSSAATAPDGAWRAQVSRDVRPGNWLPAGQPGSTGPFTVTLRLFDPAPAATESPHSIALPRVVRQVCS